MKMFKFIKIILIFLITMFFCKQKDELHSINEIPMYGNIKKSKEQLHSDSVFVNEILLKCTNRTTASIEVAKRGWELFKKGDRRTAIKRFNQSWLLDSLCPYALWGFGVYTGSFGNYSDAISFLRKAIKYLPENANLLSDLAFTYGTLSYSNKSHILKDTAMVADSLFKIAFMMDSSNTVILNQWLLTKYLLGECDKAHELRTKLISIYPHSIDVHTIDKMKRDLNINCNE